MWKARRPSKEEARADTEDRIERRDNSIRDLIDELVSGTLQLKSIYPGPGDKKKDDPKPA